MDGDGKADIIVTNSYSPPPGNGTVSVFWNTANSGSITSSSFATKVDFTTGSSPYGVAIGDLDGDGKPDIAVANYLSNNASILRNTPQYPTISTTGTLSAFTSCAGTASPSQSFSVSGTNLSTGITITAPTGYEVSTTLGSGYGSSVTLTQSNGTVSSPIYVRLTSSATGSPSGSITCTSTNATTQNIALSGTVNSLPATPSVSAGGITAFCSGGSVVLTSNAVSGNQWYNNGTIISGAVNTTYPATATGTIQFK